MIALLLYGIFFIVLPRIRDIGLSGWWLFLIFVPAVDIVFSIILLFRAPALLSNKPHTVPEPT